MPAHDRAASIARRTAAALTGTHAFTAAGTVLTRHHALVLATANLFTTSWFFTPCRFFTAALLTAALLTTTLLAAVLRRIVVAVAAALSLRFVVTTL